MSRQILNRFTRQFLSYPFPENIKPAEKLNKKAEKILQYKRRFLSKTAKEAQNNIIIQSTAPLSFQQNKKNLAKDFDIDNLWFQDHGHQLLQQKLFPLIQTLQKRIKDKKTWLDSSRINSQNNFRNKTMYKASYNKAKSGDFSGKKVLTIFKKQNRKLSFLFSLNQLKIKLLKTQAQFMHRLDSDYKYRFLERKKLSQLYGNLKKKQLQKNLKQAKSSHSRTIENFLYLLESRLDVTLYRISFCKTISAGHQMITHSQVLVNGVITRQPGFLLKPGDIISIVESKSSKIKRQIIQNLVSAEVYRPDSESSLKKASRFLFPNTLYLNSFSAYTNSSDPQKFVQKNSLNNKFFNISTKESLTVQGNFPEEGHCDYSFRSQRQLLNKRTINVKLWSQTFHDFYKDKLRIKRTSSSVLRRKYSPLLKTFFLESKKSRTSTLQSSLRLAYNNKKALSFSQKQQMQYTNLFKNLLTQRFLYKERSRKLVRQGLRVNPMKPLHLEVSYTLLKAVFLYSPQKLVFPGSLDLDLVFRELQS